MTTYGKGDVVLVHFNFTDGTGSKRRPAVVISGGRYNATAPDILIAAVTSNLNAVPHPGDRVLQDWQAAGLLKPSLAQMKIATVEPAAILRVLGTLTARDLRAIEAGLREAFDLS